MRYIETGPKSPKNQKFIDTYFQESTFTKIAPYSRSDQTKPSGILHSVQHHVRAYQKNFSSLAPSGAEKIDPEVSKFEKCYFLVFLKKGPQGPPKRSKINSSGIFGYRGPKWPTKKIFGNFRDGGAKSVYMLTEWRLLSSSYDLSPVSRSLNLRDNFIGTTHLCQKVFNVGFVSE